MYKIISQIINLISLVFVVLPNKYDILLLQKFKNEKNVNYTLIENELIDCKIKYVYSPNNGLKSFIIDLFYIQMSKTVIVDSYSLALSNVRRNKKKRIIQIWHALGAIKKFGFQSLDTANGRKSSMAYGLKMHHNYSFVVSSGSATTPIFKEAFKCEVKEFVLPYVKTCVKNKPLEIKKALYLPTYRSSSIDGYSLLINNLSDEYELVYKPHPQDVNKALELGIDVYLGDIESAIAKCDLVITDYSATCFDAYLKGKSVIFFVWDYDNYCLERGVNVDFSKMSNVCYDASQINKVISNLKDNELGSYLDAKEEFIAYLKKHL